MVCKQNWQVTMQATNSRINFTKLKTENLKYMMPNLNNNNNGGDGGSSGGGGGGGGDAVPLLLLLLLLQL